TGIEHLHDLLIDLNLGGKEYILELKLNRELLTGNFFQKHQENGKQKVHRPKPEEVELCQYQGHLKGIPKSWAAVSTCSGLSGVVFDGNELHYLEPGTKFSKSIFSDKELGDTYHYKHTDLAETNHSCGYEGTPHKVLQNEHIVQLHRSKRGADSVADDGMTEIRGPYNANKKTRYVELVLVVDHKEFLELDSSKEKVYQHCKDIANIINALYMPLNIFIALVGVVVWSEFDEIALVTNGDTTLTNFLHYRRERLVKEHPNDNAQLLTRIQFENGVVGKALKGPICTYEFSGGVSMDHSNVVGLVATTVAHEMGHNFGMEHDSSDCNCPSERCIMAPSSSTLSPTQWSSCSEKYLLLAFHHGMDYCLHNKPTKLFGSPVCGNGFVEHGEQCDCGLESRCSNPCCNAVTCMLHANASCATGECCDFETCRPKAAGSVCRSADQECDLPEFCTGRSEYCPIDVFKMDGESCNHGKAFCYKGMCRTRSDQCKLLWGPSGKSSDTQCYKMNVKGTRHGNCGFNRLNQSYVKCVDDNIYCGMLHCKHLNERLEFGMESVAILSHSFINSGGSIIPCRTAIVDLGLNEVDPGLAPDGSKCGEDKMCVNQKCMAVSSLRAGSVLGDCPQNCNGNGVCNSKGHCHCNPGFAPPFCDYPGTGGSEDSGPATDPNAGRKFVTALYIIFLGIVPFVALMALLMYYTRPLVKHWWKKPGTIAVNGTRQTTYVPKSASACCMSIGRWTRQLNCSNSCRHVTKPQLPSLCTGCFHSQASSSGPKVKSSLHKHEQSVNVKDFPVSRQSNALAVGQPSHSFDAIVSAPIPSISGTIISKEKYVSNKTRKTLKLWNTQTSFWRKRKKLVKFEKYSTSRKFCRDIVKSDLVFTTNPEVQRIMGQSSLHGNCTSSLVNVPVRSESLDQETKVASCDTMQKVLSQSSELDGHCVKEMLSLDNVSPHNNPSHEEGPMIGSCSKAEEKNFASHNIFNGSNSIIINYHASQKKKFPKVDSYGVASSKLITEVIEVVPKHRKASGNNDGRLRSSFRKKKPGGQNRTGRGNSLAFHSRDRCGAPKLNGSAVLRDVSSPVSDGTHASLLPRAATPVNSPSSSNDGSPVSNLQISLIGQFKGFSITPMSQSSPTRYSEDPVRGAAAPTSINKPAPSSPAQSGLRKAPAPPSVPSISLNASSRPVSSKSQSGNKLRHNASVVNAVSSINNSSVAPALPPANSQASGRPLISSPILDATTSSTARDLVDGSHVTIAPSTSAPIRPAPSVPVSEYKLPQPVTITQERTVSTSSEKPSNFKQPQYPTLTKLASMLRPSTSFRTQEKREESQNVKAGKLLDKEKLRSLQISNPIPQQEIEIPNAVPVQGSQPVVMRAQSMRAGANSKRPNIQSFGSMRQPGKRPTSVVSSSLHRPTSPPPPRPPPLPDFSSKEAEIIGMPGYQNPPEAKANKLPSDYSYDDCLNVMGDAPLAHIDEESSPTSGDNIYAVIEESPQQGGRNRVNFAITSKSSNVDVPEYISPTASVYKTPITSPTIQPAGSSESMGLLGEIVSAIQARNTESIYSSSSIPPKKSDDETSASKNLESHSKFPSKHDSNNFSDSTSSSGYLSPNVTNSGHHMVGSVVNALQSPSTAAPAAITTATTTSTSSTAGRNPGDSYKSYGASLRTRGPLASTFSRPNVTSSISAPTPPPASQKPQLLTKKPVKSGKMSSSQEQFNESDANEKSSLTSTSPDVVSSCSSSADTSSPDVISPASAGKSGQLPSEAVSEQIATTLKPIGKGTSSLRPTAVKPAISASKPSLDVSGSNKASNPQSRAAASKISNVASLQQKFETGSTKSPPTIKPRVPSSKPTLPLNK
ncbi:Disintegrin and metalloproteinase domain-containing protein 12, partial [Frankliniella fusca]